MGTREQSGTTGRREFTRGSGPGRKVQGPGGRVVVLAGLLADALARLLPALPTHEARACVNPLTQDHEYVTRPDHLSPHGLMRCGACRGSADARVSQRGRRCGTGRGVERV